MSGDATTTRTYKGAGVDIAAGAELVEAIRTLAESTARPGARGELGGFAGLFDLAAAGFRDPVLVAATDGVGTKLKIAFATGAHATVGIDLVAMCTNDLLVQGAEPLFFLDYFATARLDPATAAEVVSGIAAGCRAAGCALIGGETAEMPGMYAAGEYDLAGFAVGAAERDRLLPGVPVAPGDVVLGLASAGLHSNGFSLVREIVDAAGLAYDSPAPFVAGASLGEALLRPTRIYVEGCLEAVGGGAVKALAHITGGGLVENIPRILPDEVGVELDAGSWPMPEVFRWLARTGGVAPEEMARTFNCGIGMAVLTAPEDAEGVAATLAAAGETVQRIGRAVPRSGAAPRVAIRGMEAAWR